MATRLPTIADAEDRRPVRLLIVDDSAVARAIFARMIAARPDFEIAATVPGADAALRFLATNAVDIILLDIEMPGMDGLTALPHILAASGGARVLIVSAVSTVGATATMRALTLGAADTLAKPARGTFGVDFARTMLEKLERIGHAPPSPPVDARATAPRLRAFGDGPLDCLAIGASTGGIHALSDLLRALPPSADAPILVTQHLPAVFMPFFATQIAEISGRPASVARDGTPVRRGHILVAPGDGHLCCERRGTLVTARILPGRVDNGCMPSVDPMLSSVARIFGASGVAVLLSGMGRDGVRGADDLVLAGGDVLAQDRGTSVVWGMPGAVAAAGLASAILDPARLAELIAHRHRAAS